MLRVVLEIGARLTQSQLPEIHLNCNRQCLSRLKMTNNSYNLILQRRYSVLLMMLIQNCWHQEQAPWSSRSLNGWIPPCCWTISSCTKNERRRIAEAMLRRQLHPPIFCMAQGTKMLRYFDLPWSYRSVVQIWALATWLPTGKIRSTELICQFSPLPPMQLLVWLWNQCPRQSPDWLTKTHLARKTSSKGRSLALTRAMTPFTFFSQVERRSRVIHQALNLHQWKDPSPCWRNLTRIMVGRLCLPQKPLPQLLHSGLHKSEKSGPTVLWSSVHTQRVTPPLSLLWGGMSLHSISWIASWWGVQLLSHQSVLIRTWSILLIWRQRWSVNTTLRAISRKSRPQIHISSTESK